MIVFNNKNINMSIKAVVVFDLLFVFFLGFPVPDILDIGIFASGLVLGVVGCFFGHEG